MSLHPTDLSSHNVANEQRAGDQQSPSTAPSALELDGISLAFRESEAYCPCCRMYPSQSSRENSFLSSVRQAAAKVRCFTSSAGYSNHSRDVSVCTDET